MSAESIKDVSFMCARRLCHMVTARTNFKQKETSIRSDFPMLMQKFSIIFQTFLLVIPKHNITAIYVGIQEIQRTSVILCLKAMLQTHVVTA